MNDINRIKKLPENIKNMIAAGEVVEGPFSVVKELMENSIDAGADDISIEIDDSGLKKILVSDNGCGIAKDDIMLAVTEHATSKISRIEDINSILSYGFRGEALSSISSISKLSVFSRQKNEQLGAKLTIENLHSEITDYAGAAGTTIIVENLFHNTPARKKFLKSHSTEAKLIREIFFKLAVPFCSISFRLEINGAKPVVLKKRVTISERISDIYGSDFAASLLHDNVKDLQVSLNGYISGPSFTRQSRKYQFLYVNNRPVDYKTMSFHLQRAYGAILQHGQFAAAFLFISVNPSLIDVNVHPAKREIKFFDTKYIDTLIYGLAKKILGQHEHDISLNENNLNEYETNKFTAPVHLASQGGTLFKQSEAYIHSGNDNYTVRNENVINDSRELYNELSSMEDNSFRVIGIVFGVYILLEKDNNLKILDLHAAHERIIFDELINKGSAVESQELMFPENIEMPADEYSLILDNIDALKNHGFDIESFSDSSFAVSAYPAVLKNPDMTDFLKDFCAQIENDTDFQKNMEKKVVERIACHSAKRRNDVMSEKEIILLAEKVFSGKYELRCPHGRPFVFNITQSEFEKIFKR